MNAPDRHRSHHHRHRRAALRSMGAAVLLLGTAGRSLGASIVAVRVWPATDYTRVTIESDAPLTQKHFLAAAPGRLVIDIDGLELSPALRELDGKVRADDPFIAAVRAGQNQPRVVRLVLDLKQPIAPQLFTLAPVAAYRHRLVFDLYPTEERDPLLALIRDRELAEQQAARSVRDALGEFIGRFDRPVGSPTATAAAGGGSATAGAGTAPGTTAAAGGAGTAVGAGAGPGAGADAIAGAAAGATAAGMAAGAATSATAVASGSGSGPGPSTASGPSLARDPAAAPVTARPGSPPLPESPESASLAGAAPQRPAAPLPPSVQRKIDRLIVVAIDAGHGGEDPGARGPGGLLEKDVVLQIAKQLRDRINGLPNMRAMLTRDADFFVPLHERVRKARRVQADLFVSIHADAFVTPEARGASVFALSEGGATSAAARWMANRENAADRIGGANIDAKDAAVMRALLDMSTTAQIRDSMKLGGEVLGQIGKVGRLHKGSVEQAGFAVLKAPDIPSILVESAFISNPEEEARLRDPEYQAQLVHALAVGIQRYFAKNPPLARSRQL